MRGKERATERMKGRDQRDCQQRPARGETNDLPWHRAAEGSGSGPVQKSADQQRDEYARFETPFPPEIMRFEDGSRVCPQQSRKHRTEKNTSGRSHWHPASIRLGIAWAP